MHKVTFVLLVIGGLNWLLEAFGWGLGSWVMADWWAMLMKIVYILVGLAAVYEAATHAKNCKMCEKKGMPSMPVTK